MTHENIELIANISLALSFLAALVFGIVESREAARNRRERLTLETLHNFQTREFAEISARLSYHKLPTSYEDFQSLTIQDQAKYIQFSQEMESLGTEPKHRTEKAVEREELEKSNKGGEKISDSKQEDIQDRDLHVKVKQLMKKENITVDQLNQIFYKENGDFKPLYDDLKTTKTAESQVRIAVLSALRNAMHNGDFQFNIEDVRKETQLRKCYDAPNFVKNFKNNASLFEYA